MSKLPTSGNGHASGSQQSGIRPWFFWLLTVFLTVIVTAVVWNRLREKPPKPDGSEVAQNNVSPATIPNLNDPIATPTSPVSTDTLTKVPILAQTNSANSPGTNI